MPLIEHTSYESVCSRVNLVLGVGRLPIRDPLEATTVALGTDKIALSEPSMFREMAQPSKTFDVTVHEVLRMAIRAGAAIAGLNWGVLEPGRDVTFPVLDGESDNLSGAEDVIAVIVRRASPT